MYQSREERMEREWRSGRSGRASPSQVADRSRSYCNWEAVNNGHNKDYVHQNQNKGRVTFRNSTSFMFFNFPTAWETVHLWNLFKRYGRVVDVYLARKRLKRGNRFGFVRFLAVEDKKRMEADLNKIWIGLYKLRVFVARSGKDSPPGSDSSLRPQEGTKVHHNQDPQKYKDSRSYVQVVKGEPLKEEVPLRKVEEMEKVRLTQSEGEKRSRLTRTVWGSRIQMLEGLPSNLEFLKSCLLCEAKELSFISEAEAACVAEGIEPLDIKHIRGLVFLIKFENERIVDNILAKKEIGLFNCCKSITKWAPHHLPDKRLAEVHVNGIPLEAWSEENFKKIVSGWGEVVHTRNCSLQDSFDFEEGIAIILTEKPLKISSCVPIEFEGKIYRISIEEERSSLIIQRFYSEVPGWKTETEVEDSDILSDWINSSDFYSQAEMEDVRSEAGNESGDPKVKVVEAAAGEQSDVGEREGREIDLNMEAEKPSGNKSPSTEESGSMPKDHIPPFNTPLGSQSVAVPIFEASQHALNEPIEDVADSRGSCKEPESIPDSIEGPIWDPVISCGPEEVQEGNHGPVLLPNKFKSNSCNSQACKLDIGTKTKVVSDFHYPGKLSMSKIRELARRKGQKTVTKGQSGESSLKEQRTSTQKNKGGPVTASKCLSTASSSNPREVGSKLGFRWDEGGNESHS